MAFLETLIPNLMNAGQNCNEAVTNLMDQDWNHWKLQFQSWLDDVKEAEGKAEGKGNTGAPGCGTAPTCGANANRNSGCCGSANRQREPTSPMDALHQMWNQFSGGRQQCPRRSQKEESNNQVNNDSKKYVIKLDVQNFEPNEITVKLVDNQIVVDGEHPERTDRLGRVSRKFQRKYDLPAEVEPDTIVSTLTPTSVLIIEGLKKNVPKETGGDIVIPVIREQTNNSDDQNKYQNDQQMD